MRIWDIAPARLCRNHLLGEHNELHAIWSIITGRKKGYSRHPEVLRWKGKLKALYIRHEKIIRDMARRGYVHKSPLPARQAKGSARQRKYVTPYREQLKLLRKKGCACRV